MSEVTRHEPGSFCWPELATSDAGAAKTFYTSLFGWSFADSPAGPDLVYTMLKKRDKSVGALYGLGPQQKNIPPHWNLYITVVSADESAKKAKALGGKVLAEAFDVMEAGRMATIQDQQGATFCVWQPTQHIGTELVNEPGTLCWGELDTIDTESAGKFYAALFGWGLKAGGDYTEFQVGGRSIGGMMKIPKEWGPVPPNWLVYFEVSDCDATEKKALESGGKAIVPSTTIENVGRFAVLQDPQGAIFAIYRSKAA